MTCGLPGLTAEGLSEVFTEFEKKFGKLEDQKVAVRCSPVMFTSLTPLSVVDGRNALGWMRVYVDYTLPADKAVLMTSREEREWLGLQLIEFRPKHFKPEGILEREAVTCDREACSCSEGREAAIQPARLAGHDSRDLPEAEVQVPVEGEAPAAPAKP